MRARTLTSVLSVPVVFVLALMCSREAGAEVRMVFTAPGEDATREMRVTWHASLPGSRLEVTKTSDPGYASATLFEGSAIVEAHDTATFDAVSFYRCHAVLDDLDSGTEYIFRIMTSSLTEDYHFRTAQGFSDFRFVHMSDVHAYPPIQSRVNRAVALMVQALEKQGDLHFLLFTGDLTAHGANYTHWENLAAASFAGDFFWATTPGNHDYYNASAETIDDRFYNAAFTNPDNGAPTAMNTTYWFRYNGAIFLSLNTEANATAQIESQRTWLREVVEENPAQYYVAFAHRAFFLGSTTTVGGGVVRKSSDSYPQFGDLLEELGVDLVLAGHNHVYVRTKPILGGEVSATGEGTVYITANQIGDRGRMAASSLGEYSEAIYGGASDGNTISTLSIITVTHEAILGQMFDAQGVVHDSYTIPARRPPLVDDFDREAYLDAFSAHVNPPDLSLGILRFGAEGHDRVRAITLGDAEVAGALYASFRPSADMTEAPFGTLEPGRTYALDLTVTFRDGTTGARQLSLLNRLPTGTVDGLRFEETEGRVFVAWDNDLVASQIDHIAVGVGDAWSRSLAPEEIRVDITSGLREGPNDVVFTVTDIYGDIVFQETLTYVLAAAPATGEACGGCGRSASVPGIFMVLLLGSVFALSRRRQQRTPS